MVKELLFLLLLQFCKPESIADTKVLDHEFPSYVQIVNKKRKGFCGGTILDSHHVLSAAHCNITAGQIVHYGTSTVGPDSGQGFVTTVKKVSTIGQRLTDSKIWSNDMAILKVSPKFKFDDVTVKRVQLGSRKEFDEYVEKGHIKCVLVGKGRVSTGEQVKYPKLLQKGFQLYDNTKTCESYLQKESDLPNIPTADGCFLTVGSDGSTGCKGDSGGPLFCLLPKKQIWKQFGIASFADKACDRRTAWWAPFVAGKFISKHSKHHDHLLQPIDDAQEIYDDANDESQKTSGSMILFLIVIFPFSLVGGMLLVCIRRRANIAKVQNRDLPETPY